MLLRDVRNIMINMHMNYLEDFRYKPTNDMNTDPYQLSMIDRGLANTRAYAITAGLRSRSWEKTVSGMLGCDDWNFPVLIRIEPRLILIALQKTNNVVLQQRLNTTLRDFEEDMKQQRVAKPNSYDDNGYLRMEATCYIIKDILKAYTREVNDEKV